MFLLENPNSLFQKATEELNTLLVYLHVPKAAGNSSIGSIKVKVGKENSRSIKWNDIEKSWSDFIVEHQEKPLSLVSGHFRFKHVLALKEANVDYKLVTFIRHPVERIISQYKYSCSENVPNYLEFRNKFKTFDDYAYRGVGPNAVSRILVQGALSFEEYLNKLKDRYAFVGLSEHYDFSMFMLMNSLGYDYEIAKKKNVTIKDSFNQFDVSKKTYDYLLEKHSLDVQLFNHFNDLYVSISKKFIVDFIQEKQNSLMVRRTS